MGSTDQRTRGRRIEWPTSPGEEPDYRACRKCDHCRTGVGRGQNPAASDCWADALDRATIRRSA